MLLLEKPVATNAAGADQLRRVCECRPDLLVAVNYIRRYLPVVLQLHKQLQNGELGELLHGRLTYGKGLLSNGSHFVNLAEAWLGPLRVKGQVQRGPVFLGFDREASLTLMAERHSDALLQVCSIGSAGLQDEGGFLSAFGLEPDGAVLVRPDAHIAWRAKSRADAAPALADALADILQRKAAA